jgi:hypothetical protein
MRNAFYHENNLIWETDYIMASRSATKAPVKNAKKPEEDPEAKALLYKAFVYETLKLSATLAERKFLQFSPETVQQWIAQDGFPTVWYQDVINVLHALVLQDFLGRISGMYYFTGQNANACNKPQYARVVQEWKNARLQ